MKFARYLLLPIILLLQVLSKKVRSKYDPMFDGVSQSTRNYRKLHTDPSFNPLPQSWTTGPRQNFANPNPKHVAYYSKLHNTHGYHDTTHVMAEKVRHMHHQ